MDKQDEIIKIISPSKEIFDIYESYKKIISIALPDAKIQLIGSFAIPMKGKEELDVLIETDDIEKTQEILTKQGFSKGPIIDREGYMHSRLYYIMCEAHIVKYEDRKIKNYLSLIEKLKNNDRLRLEYEQLKESFNYKTKEEYRKAKNLFLIDNKLV